MKITTYVFLLVIFPFFINAQTIALDPATSLFATSAFIQIDSTSKDLLFERAAEWLSLNYKSARDVIELSDKERGKLICKGNLRVSAVSDSGWIEHTLVLEFRDNGFRYTYTNFAYEHSNTGIFDFEDLMMGRKRLIRAEEEIVLIKAEEAVKASIDSLRDYL